LECPVISYLLSSFNSTKLLNYFYKGETGPEKIFSVFLTGIDQYFSNLGNKRNQVRMCGVRCAVCGDKASGREGVTALRRQGVGAVLQVNVTLGLHDCKTA